jgi:hypothetical protein
MKIDILGDGVLIDVPEPKGGCSNCKWASAQIFIGTEYITQPQREICKGCSIANGMENYEKGKIDWWKLTKLTEEHPVVVTELIKSWKKRSMCDW